MKIIDNRELTRNVSVGDVIVENGRYFWIVQTFDGYATIDMAIFAIDLVEDTISELIACYDNFEVVPKDRLSITLS